LKIFRGNLIEITDKESGFYLKSKINTSLKIENIIIKSGFYIVTHVVYNDGGKHLVEILYNNNLVMIKFNEQNFRIICN
jgi:hypothetical protein